MAKYFGSRLPVSNYILTNLAMLGFFGRLKYVKFRNKLKSKSINKTVKLVNDESTKSEFQSFLDSGIKKVNIGGGQYNLEGYVNIDFADFPNVKHGLVANILDLSFIPDNSLSHIYSNQVMEHLTEEQLLEQFRHYRRVLKSGGVLSFRTPNALGVCYGFWFGMTPEQEREAFVELGYPADAFFFDERDGWYHKDLYALVHWLYADAGNIKNQHLTIFTPTKVNDYLVQSGFEVIKMTKPETTNIIVCAKPL